MVDTRMINQQLCHRFGHPAEKIKLVSRRGSNRIYRCVECGQTSANGRLRIRDWHDEIMNDAIVLEHASRALEN
jgi:uncharacterized Zn finger protein